MPKMADVQAQQPKALETVGNTALAFFTFVGETTLILLDAIRRLFKRPFEWQETVNQMAFLGVSSVPIVLLTGFFSGAVFSLYLTTFLTKYGAASFVGATVGLSVTREIGPVIAGIMVAARCGSAMAAQIGTMQVTEQVDALRMLSVHPSNYLVIPRLIAGITMLPVLALVCMYSAIVGGALVGVTEGLPTTAFVQSVQQFVTPHDLFSGCIKTPFFGLIIGLVACQQGLRTRKGAVGVGNATTNTVVISMVLIYIANFLLAKLMY